MRCFFVLFSLPDWYRYFYSRTLSTWILFYKHFDYFRKNIRELNVIFSLCAYSVQFVTEGDNFPLSAVTYVYNCFRGPIILDLSWNERTALTGVNKVQVRSASWIYGEIIFYRKKFGLYRCAITVAVQRVIDLSCGN